MRAVHCPQSNLKLGSGTCDIERLKRRGLIVGLGTDGAAANNTLDLFTEVRVAALLAKTITGDPTCTRCIRGAGVRDARQRPRARPRRNDRLDRTTAKPPI